MAIIIHPLESVSAGSVLQAQIQGKHSTCRHRGQKTELSSREVFLGKLPSKGTDPSSLEE